MATTHYVDNKQLYQVMVEYKEKVNYAKKHDTPRPDVPNYVGECILMIAKRLCTKPNFINYSYKEEMVSDGIENCISYIDNFDPQKSNNPFAYFTQIIYYAFLRRILKEKKQMYIKHKTLENSMLFQELIEQQGASDNNMPVNQFDNFEYENTYEFIKSFEETLTAKKKKRKKGVENFIEEEGVSKAALEEDDIK
jgi:DNA-directed RNA polymerase specialized sigma24 family protein